MSGITTSLPFGHATRAPRTGVLAAGLQWAFGQPRRQARTLDLALVAVIGIVSATIGLGMLGLAVALVFAAVLARTGAWRGMVLRSRSLVARQKPVGTAWLVTTGLLAMLSASRDWGTVTLDGLSAEPLLLALACAVPRLRRLRGTRLLLVGSDREVGSFLTRHPEMGRAAGVCLTSDPSEAAKISGIPVVGAHPDVARAAGKVRAHTVVLFPTSLSGSNPVGDDFWLRRLSWELSDAQRELLVMPVTVEVPRFMAAVGHEGRDVCVSLAPRRVSGVGRVAKELIDRTLALVALLFLLPMFVVLAVVVRQSSAGPILFRQTRVGQSAGDHLRTFRMLKFRSMYVDAEQRLADLAQANVHTSGPLFKIADDPRITPTGRWMRRYSLDELPQLINVLLGQMSLIGPRPALPSEVAEYTNDERRRLVVKPGLTGLWQVSGRSDLDWSQSVGCDLDYVDGWSLALDARILSKTLGVVARAKGAY